MFAINHAATALVLKRRYPTVRMAFILLAVQAVELLWVALNLLGVETTTTDATVRSVQNIHLVHMPWSHSLATTLAFSVVAWTFIRFALGKPKIAIAVALGMASHLLLDLVTHSPDIAIAPGLAVQKLGTGFYSSVPLVAFLLELGFGIVCWRIYRGSRWLLLAIIGFNVANLSMFLPQLVGIEAALAGQPTTLTLIILAQIVVTLAMVGWLSRRRDLRSASKPLFKEPQHAVERLLGRMPVVIDELLGEDTVGHSLDSPRIVGAGVDLDPLEPVAQLSSQRFETRAGADRVGCKPEAEHLHTFFAHPSLDD